MQAQHSHICMEGLDRDNEPLFMEVGHNMEVRPKNTRMHMHKSGTVLSNPPSRYTIISVHSEEKKKKSPESLDLFEEEKVQAALK